MDSKRWLKSKTIWFNLFVALVVVISEQSDLVKTIIANDVGYNRLMFVVTLANTYLRLITVMPVTTTKP